MSMREQLHNYRLGISTTLYGSSLAAAFTTGYIWSQPQSMPEVLQNSDNMELSILGTMGLAGMNKLFKKTVANDSNTHSAYETEQREAGLAHLCAFFSGFTTGIMSEQGYSEDLALILAGMIAGTAISAKNMYNNSRKNMNIPERKLVQTLGIEATVKETT